MREKVFKYSIVSLVIVNFWSMYMFFSYFFESGAFRGLGLFFNFLYSVFYAFGYGCILLIIRLLIYWRKKRNPLITNFFYMLGAIFSLNLFLVYFIAIILGVLKFDEWMLPCFAIGLLLISCFILTDIYKSVFRIKE